MVDVRAEDDADERTAEAFIATERACSAVGALSCTRPTELLAGWSRRAVVKAFCDRGRAHAVRGATCAGCRGRLRSGSATGCGSPDRGAVLAVSVCAVTLSEEGGSPKECLPQFRWARVLNCRGFASRWMTSVTDCDL